MQIAKLILAAMTSAGLALATNLILGKMGPKGILYIGPTLEEGFKTGFALFFHVSVPGTHILFGFLEAVGDFFWGGRRKILAGVFGITAHTVFGLVTYFLIRNGVPVFLAVLGSIAFHIAWNTAVLKMSK